MLRMLLANPPYGHGKHDSQGESRSQAHFFESANGVPLKSERDIQPTVDPLHRRAVIIFPIPLITGSINGGKDSAIRL